MKPRFYNKYEKDVFITNIDGLDFYWVDGLRQEIYIVYGDGYGLPFKIDSDYSKHDYYGEHEKARIAFCKFKDSLNDPSVSPNSR